MNKVMAETCEENNIPVILFNRFIPGIKISTVYVDPIEGGGMAAEYLLKKGHKNIGYIQFTRETSEEMEKKIGFYSKLRQSGIHNLKEESANYDYDSGYEAGKRMLALSNPPTAIFCTSDLIAIGGYDDIQMASWKSYNLTTIRQPLDLLIEKTINILKSLLNEENPESVVEMLKPELIERGSTL